LTGGEIREALRSGRRVYATAAIAPSPRWPDVVRHAGVDFVFIDSEHIPLGRESLAWLCRAYAAQGIPPVVRIPSPDPFEARKVLDGGAAGVIAPYIETAEQVRALAGAARWRPLNGGRLRAALEDPGTLEPGLHDYLTARNADTVFIINIESVPAIENLDDILSVPGLDAVLIGPHDLSCSLGIPEQYRHPRFDEAVRTILRAARRHGVGAGIHFWAGIDQEIAWARAGANLLMHSSDLLIFRDVLRREIDELKTALDDPLTGRKPTEADGVV
jgi:2-keto-3-deoxy-L-rhamnonate aldolase RhmA